MHSNQGNAGGSWLLAVGLILGEALLVLQNSQAQATERVVTRTTCRSCYFAVAKQ